MSALIFHPQLRFVLLCYLPIEDQLRSYRPINSQSMDGAVDHITEVVVEYVNCGIEFSGASFARQYWPRFCKLHRVESEVFRPTLEQMFREIPEDTDRFQREKVGLCWSNMGNLSPAAHFKCIHPITGAEHSYDPLQCFVQALEIAPTLGRAWRNLSLELNRKCTTVTVSGEVYTALTAIVKSVREDPTAFTGWLTLGFLLGTGNIELWPGTVVAKVDCYIRALELEGLISRFDVSNKADAWFNLALVIQRNWEKGDKDHPTSFIVNRRPVGMVECLVESIRCQERSTTWLLLATAMRGLTREESLSAAGRHPNMPVVEKVNVLHEHQWTALQCVARALRHTKQVHDVFRTAAEIQYLDKGVSSEQLVVNGEYYDTMQCFVKAWLVDPKDEASKAPFLWWYRARYFADFSPDRPVVVEGESYVLVINDTTGVASRWEKQEETSVTP